LKLPLFHSPRLPPLYPPLPLPSAAMCDSALTLCSARVIPALVTKTK
jgi:hypothetical protein